MPTYNYQCPACGHEFEKFHKITAKLRPKCPQCGKTAQRMITGGAGLLFKGSGFYITDYKKSGGGEKGERAQTGQEGQKEGEKGPKGKPSDKPATKKPGDDH